MYILDMLRCFGHMILVWDEGMQCFYLFSGGKDSVPFLLSYPYRQLETQKVSFASKDAKEDFKRRTDFFFSYGLTQKKLMLEHIQRRQSAFTCVHMSK